MKDFHRKGAKDKEKRTLSAAKATVNLGDGDRRFGKAEGVRRPQAYWKYAEDRSTPEAQPKRRDPSPSIPGVP